MKICFLMYMEIRNNYTASINNNVLENKSNIRYNLWANGADEVSFSHTNKADKQSFMGKVKNKISTFYRSVYSGFEEHFFKPQDKVVYGIELTKNQKKELKEKIEEFEKYKSSLSKSELESLEKNKHGLIDFSIKNGNPDEKLTGYKEFLSKYERFKKGDFSGITNEDLAQLIYYTDTTDLISDKKIGSFAQGRTGDCWYLAMLGNYASTPAGEKNIANRISGPDKKGDYTVKFNNPLDAKKSEEYKVTKEELENYDLLNIDTYFSSGDLDVRILEIATDKMLFKYLTTAMKTDSKEYLLFGEFKAQEEPKYSPAHCMAAGFLQKRALVHKALGYKNSPKTYYSFKDDKEKEDILSLYTTQENIKSIKSNIVEIEMQLIEKKDGTIEYKPRITQTEYKSLSEIISANNISAEELTVGSGAEDLSEDEKVQRYLSAGHEYNVLEMNNGNITVMDPYNSAFPHNISTNQLDNYFGSISYFPRN